MPMLSRQRERALLFISSMVVVLIIALTFIGIRTNQEASPEDPPVAASMSEAIPSTTTTTKADRPSTTTTVDPNLTKFYEWAAEVAWYESIPTTTTTTTPPPPKPQAATTPAPTGSNGAFLDCVKQRESGGDYTVVSSGGDWRGAYQFTQSTWNSTAQRAGRGDLVGVQPEDASPADQDAMAQALYEWQGSTPWAGGSHPC